MKEAEKYLSQIEAQISPSFIRSSMYFFLKFWAKAFKQIVVNKDQMDELRGIIQRKQQNVVLVPTHKSYMDIWILGFIHLQLGLEYPFVCGDQSLFNIAFISSFIKNSGAFLLKPELLKNEMF